MILDCARLFLFSSQFKEAAKILDDSWSNTMLAEPSAPWKILESVLVQSLAGFRKSAIKRAEAALRVHGDTDDSGPC